MKSQFLLPLFAAASLLCAIIPPTQANHPADVEKRQCRSVHLRFSKIPEASKAIYVESSAVKSSPGTYFCASSFNDGYIGFQEQSNGKKVIIFSIWDPVAHGDNPNDVPEHERVKLITKGKDTRDGRFGNEGTGGQSFIDYDWKIGEKMKFLVIRKPVNDKFKQISGYFYDNKARKWQLISCWQTHRSEKEFSYSTSFVEDFFRNYESAKQTREGAFGPTFAYSMQNKWVSTREGTFTGDSNPSKAVKATLNEKTGQFHISTGGDIKEENDFKLFTSKRLPESVKLTPPGNDIMELINAPLEKESSEKKK